MKISTVIFLTLISTITLRAEIWHENRESFNGELTGVDATNAYFLVSGGEVRTVPVDHIPPRDRQIISARIKQHKILMSAQKQQIDRQAKLIGGTNTEEGRERVERFKHLLVRNGGKWPEPHALKLSEQLEMDKYEKGLMPLKEMITFEHKILKRNKHQISGGWYGNHMRPGYKGYKW